MSTRVRPSKYFVPKLTEEYIGDFGEHSNTTEANVLRLLLERDTSTSPIPAIAVKGVGGSGKTTVLVAVGNQEKACTRFSKAVWFIVLGQDAHPTTLLENLEELVRSVVGKEKADEIGRLSRLRDKSSAVAEAIRVLKEHDVLLLLDDVWADEQQRVWGQSTVFSLVRDCLKRVQGNPGRLRAVVSTRDAGVAALVKEGCRVNTEPFQAREATAREMLCRYAKVSVEAIETSSSQVQESCDSVLDRCGGLPLALAVAGSVIRERTTFGHVKKDEVWGMYAAELEGMEKFLKLPEPQSDHPGLYAMVESSLKGVGSYLRPRFAFWDEVKLLFSFLGVLRKQEAVPLSVVECIWGLTKKEAVELLTALERMHLVSLMKEKGELWMRVHDVILGCCDVMLSEAGLRSLTHRGTVDRLEMRVLQRRDGERTKDWLSEWAAWWCKQLRDAGQGEWMRDYCRRNLARHMVKSGGKYIQRLLYLITDYGWIEMHVNLSNQGNDASGILQDVQTFVTECGEELNEDVQRGVELISDAVRLSLLYVANNPQELPYQLQGRLAEHAGQNTVVDYFLWTLDRCAARPWLKAGKGVLTAAGGPVVLHASLPNRLWCVAVLPNGEDVVVGGDDGYLVVFSIRYGSVLYELCGHNGFVSCVAVCTTRKMIFSCGRDRTVRAWELVTVQKEGNILVRNERKIHSLAVIADGSRLVFGDEGGWLVVCNSTSGDVIFKWRAHNLMVTSLAVRDEGRMILSGSYDGTIGMWESANGRDVGTGLATGAEKVYSVVVSRDGKRIAFAANKKVGVLDAGTGDILREHETELKAPCVVFGSDDETVHFGRSDGTTAALAPNGDVVCDLKTHSAIVWGLAQSHKSNLIVSVSRDCTLVVQNLQRANVTVKSYSNSQYELQGFVVLPDRKRVLYSWLKGPQGLWLLNLDKAPPKIALGIAELINASAIVGSPEADVVAVAASRDGCYAVAGTKEGGVLVYDASTWRPKFANLGPLHGAVWSVAISNDGGFLAAGFGASVVLFRHEDGSEVQLPCSTGLGEETLKVVFGEESSSLFAMVGNKSQATGMLHVWKHIDQAPNTRTIALPFDKVSQWYRPFYTMSVLANSCYIAIRDRTRAVTCVYNFSSGQHSRVLSEEEDESGLLKISNQEHAAFEAAGSLFIAPFERTIRYCHGSDSDVLGTLEAPICHSFRPDQWTFDDCTGLFVAGSFGCRLLSAVLMRGGGNALTSRSGVPKLPHVHKAAAFRASRTDSDVGMKASHYNVFISHARPDKYDIAIPLYYFLVGEKGITAFLDREELRPGDQAPKKMVAAMETADVGVFITSPEFVCRWWPMKELSCFLRRTKEAEGKARKPPTVLPVFYRLDVHECRKSDLFNKSEVNRAAVDEGFFSEERQQKMSIPEVLEHLRGLADFEGIENEEGVVNDAEFRELRTWNRMGRIENQKARDRLLKEIVEAIIEVLARKERCTDESGGEGNARRVGGENSG